MQRLTPKKGQLPLLLILLALVVLGMIFIAQSSHSGQGTFHREYVKSGGNTLDVAIELTPGVYRVAGDSAIGRDYEMLKRISRECSVPMKFHPFVPLSHAMEGLEAGKYDVVVASMPATSELKEKYLMTEPVYLDREVLVQRVGDAITSQLDLGGDTVWISNDSPIAARIENLSQEIGDTIYIQQDPRYGAEHLIILVNSGAIRLAVVNESVAKSMKKDYPDIDISTPVSFTQFQCWAVGREELRDSLNGWLHKLGFAH